MQRCLIIRNPASRRQLKPAQIDAAAGMLRAAGWDVTISVTERAGHATEVAREAAAQMIDVVIANGGDGTINEIINGLAGTDTALAVLPAGTANVWAKEIRVPKDPAKAMRVVLGGERRRMDLGIANGRYFLLMAGIGLDAAIIPRVNPWLKRRAGALAYVLAGIATALRTKPWDARVQFDEDSIDTPLYWMVAGNTRNYGGLVNITHRALADDGAIDGALMRRGGWRMLTDGVRVLLHRHERSGNVIYRQGQEIVIETPGIPVQLDGDACGETPLRITVAPLALTVIVPAGARLEMFSAPAARAVT
jgi:diacylglycerol kinase (ATP)